MYENESTHKVRDRLSIKSAIDNHPIGVHINITILPVGISSLQLCFTCETFLTRYCTRVCSVSETFPDTEDDNFIKTSGLFCFGAINGFIFRTQNCAFVGCWHLNHLKHRTRTWLGDFQVIFGPTA